MTEIAVYEEPGTIEPLNKTQAKALDKKIRSTSDRIISSHAKTLALWDDLKVFVAQAKEGEIHKALGLKSWTAYLRDAVNVTVTERDDRKAVSQFLSEQGASQRVIAGMLGVSQKTVDRDLEDVDYEEGATVTSLNGAERAATKPKDDEPLDVEYEEVEEVEPQQDSAPTPAVELVKLFNDETANLWAAYSEMHDMLGEEKWAGARNRVAKANLNSVQEIVKGLQDIVDDLMGA